MSKKVILFIGGTGVSPPYSRVFIRSTNRGTGAQGIPAIKAMLAPGKNGEPSPYTVRVLTRDPANYRAVELKGLGCEIVTGKYSMIESESDANGIFSVN
jgi:hypothetical protein